MEIGRDQSETKETVSQVVGVDHRRRVLRISWTEYKTNVWVRQKIGVPEQNGQLEQLKKRKLAKYGHWKRRSEGVVMAVTEGEIVGKCLPVDGEQHG